MAHIRTQIREALTTRLSGLSLTGTNVFPSAIWPIPTDSLPAILITTPKDERLDGGGGRFEHDCTVIVAIRAQAVAGFEATVDAVCVDVETAIETDWTLGGVAAGGWLDDTAIRMDKNADQVVIACDMSYRFRYFYDGDDPQTPTN